MGFNPFRPVANLVSTITKGFLQFGSPTPDHHTRLPCTPCMKTLHAQGQGKSILILPNLLDLPVWGQRIVNDVYRPDQEQGIDDLHTGYCCCCRQMQGAIRYQWRTAATGQYPAQKAPEYQTHPTPSGNPDLSEGKPNGSFLGWQQCTSCCLYVLEQAQTRCFGKGFLRRLQHQLLPGKRGQGTGIIQVLQIGQIALVLQVGICG